LKDKIINFAFLFISTLIIMPLKFSIFYIAFTLITYYLL
jgi:hypothetical protein